MWLCQAIELCLEEGGGEGGWFLQRCGCLRACENGVPLLFCMNFLLACVSGPPPP
jgi:hypothetical protein